MSTVATLPVNIDDLRQKRNAAKLRGYVARRVDIKETIDALEEERREINGHIEDEFGELGIDGVRVGEHSLTLIVVDGRESVDIDRLRGELLTRGVKAAVVADAIQAATKKGKPHTEVRLTKIKSAL